MEVELRKARQTGLTDCPEAAKPLSEDEKCAWLRLIRTPQIGGVTFWQLLDHFGSAEAALAALPDFAKHGGSIAAREHSSASGNRQGA